MASKLKGWEVSSCQQENMKGKKEIMIESHSIVYQSLKHAIYYNSPLHTLKGRYR